MANILVRSPRFESVTMVAGNLSAQLLLYIGGVLRYTIVKNASVGEVVTFEIAEESFARVGFTPSINVP